MKIFDALRRFRLQLARLRWPGVPPDAIPLERPPGSRSPRVRIQVLWYGDPTHAFPFEVESPPSRLDGHRLRPWF